MRSIKKYYRSKSAVILNLKYQNSRNGTQPIKLEELATTINVSCKNNSQRSVWSGLGKQKLFSLVAVVLNLHLIIFTRKDFVAARHNSFSSFCLDVWQVGDLQIELYVSHLLPNLFQAGSHLSHDELAWSGGRMAD